MAYLNAVVLFQVLKRSLDILKHKAMNFFTELSNRLSSNSPIFFKKLQAFGLYLTGFGGALLAIPSLPPKISDIGGYVITAGAVITAISKLPVKDPDYSKLDKKQDETGA